MKKPKKPDRFERMVKKTLCHTGSQNWMHNVVVVRLLRRQHAAYVRMVERDTSIYCDNYRSSILVGDDPLEWDFKLEALQDVLESFEKYKH